MSAERMAMTASGSAILGMASERLHSFFCGLHGHDMVLNIEPSRISLQCLSCPYETPGWTLKEQRSPAPSPGRHLTPRALLEQNAP